MESVTTSVSKLDIAHVKESFRDPGIDVNADLSVDPVLSDVGLVLDGKNDAAEFDDTLATSDRVDDPRLVCLAFNTNILPSSNIYLVVPIINVMSILL